MASLVGGTNILVSSSGVTVTRGGRALGARHIMFEPTANGTSVAVFGAAGNTTASPGAAAAGFQDAHGHTILCTTVAASGSVAGVSSSASNEVQTRWDFDSAFTFSLSSVTAIRLWVGLFSADPAASDDPAVTIAGFRFSTGASDPAIMAVAKGAGSINAVSTGVALAASTFYTFRVNPRVEGTAIDYYVNNVLTNTLTTDLPAVSTFMGMRCHVTSLEAVSKIIGWYGMETWESYPVGS